MRGVVEYFILSRQKCKARRRALLDLLLKPPTSAPLNAVFNPLRLALNGAMIGMIAEDPEPGVIRAETAACLRTFCMIRFVWYER